MNKSKFIMTALLFTFIAGTTTLFAYYDEHEEHEHHEHHEEHEHHNDHFKLLDKTVELKFTFPDEEESQVFTLTTATSEYGFIVRENNEILEVRGHVHPTDSPSQYVVSYHISAGSEEEEFQLHGSAIFKDGRKQTVATLMGEKIMVEIDILK